MLAAPRLARALSIPARPRITGIVPPGVVGGAGRAPPLPAAPETAAFDVGLQALAEIPGADDGDGDCDEEQHDCDDREEREGFAGREVVGAARRGRVHADEFEDEVGEGGVVEELFSLRQNLAQCVRSAE